MKRLFLFMKNKMTKKFDISDSDEEKNHTFDMFKWI